MDLHVGVPRVIVDGDVEVVVAGAASFDLCCLWGTPAHLPATSGPDPPEPSRRRGRARRAVALEADRRTTHPVAVTEPRDTAATKDRIDRRAWMAELRTEAVRTDLQPASGSKDPFHLWSRERMGTSLRSARA